MGDSLWLTMRGMKILGSGEVYVFVSKLDNNFIILFEVEFYLCVLNMHNGKIIMAWIFQPTS